MQTNALDSITIKGFKSIASIADLKLRPINLLIGPNGSGKSNFIGVFSFLTEAFSGHLRNYVIEAGGAEKVLHFGSKKTRKIFLGLGFREPDFGPLPTGYKLELSPTGDDGLYVSEEIISHPAGDTRFTLPFRGGREIELADRAMDVYLPGGDDQLGIEPTIRHLRSIGFPTWRSYHFHDTSTSSLMRKTAEIDNNRFLRPDGSNLASFLFLLKQENGDSFEFVQRTVQQVAPFFEAFHLEPLRLNKKTIKLEWRHKSSDQYFDASSLSDGTLRFIALATLFLQPKDFRPPIILVDEPELGLHPYAIELLASMIRQASVDTQVIVSSQSSLLLDHFEPEDVLVANRVDGGTQLERLDSANLSQWLQDYSLGQLWEKNEIGGRPKPE